MTDATICLWYQEGAKDAATFYADTFPDSHVGAIHRAPGELPDGAASEELTVEFTVLGIPCIGINGGSAFQQSEAFSFQVHTTDQEETDRLWHAIVDNGGQESQCGWCKDRWGVNWQITPKRLTELVNGPDPDRAQRAWQAMLQMKKIDIAALDAAADST